MRAGRNGGEHLGAEQTDAGPGAARFVRGRQAARGVDAEVAVRVVRRIGHQPQVGQSAARGEARGIGGVEAEVGQEHVARDDPKRVVLVVVRQPGQGLGDAAGGLQRAAVVAAFGGVADRKAPARAVAERSRELVFEPGGVDHHLTHAGACQRFEVPFDQRLAAHRQQRLRAGVGERAHAFAAAGGQDQGRGLDRHRRGSVGRHGGAALR